MIVPRRIWGKKRTHKRKFGKKIAVIFVLLILGAGTVNYARPIPSVAPQLTKAPVFSAEPIQLNWPSFGQSAIATSDLGVLATNGMQKPLATASIAKVITALCILEKYPLNASENGPNVPISAADVAIYDDYISKDGSAVAVEEGETLSEYQLLEALLLPSANNLADSGAIWAYGSLDAYVQYANTWLASNGLTSTHAGVDASGFDGATTSTASDLARLGGLALKQPVLREIMAKRSADLPVVGTVYNYNAVLGQAGIFGVKTGNNDQDLGAFLFAADVPVGVKTVTVTGAVMDASSLREALQTAVTLVDSVKSNFSTVTVVTAGQTMGTYTAPWGASTAIVTAKSFSVLRWNGQAITSKDTASTVQPDTPEQSVGQLQVRLTRTAGSVPLKLSRTLPGPSFWWRLTRH